MGGFVGTASFGSSGLNFTIQTLNTVEAYDPSNGTFSTAAEAMANGRAFASSIAFPGDVSSAPFLDSHVLVWDGLCDSSSFSCATANIIHPEEGSNPKISTTSFPKSSRMLAQLTLLGDSTVLATGGIADFSGGTLSSAELFTPSNEGIVAIAAPMSSARTGHTATLLNDGTVLIVGGAVNSGGTLSALNTAEIYDPSSQTFSAVPATLNQSRIFHTATLLSNGTVLIAGGFDGSATFSMTGSASGENGTLAIQSGTVLRTAEIYNPATKTFACVKGTFKKAGLCRPSMKSSRFFQTATPLSNGEVLLTGGFGAVGGAAQSAS